MIGDTVLELGIVFAFCAALGFGTNQIFVRMATQKISGPATAFFSVSTGAVIAVTLALIFHLDDFKTLPLIVFPWFLLLATVHHPLARVLNFTAISMVGASRAAPLNSAAPVWSAVLAIVALGERPGVMLYVGTFVVVAGMTLIVLGGGQRASGTGQGQRKLSGVRVCSSGVLRFRDGGGAYQLHQQGILPGAYHGDVQHGVRGRCCWHWGRTGL